MSDNGAEFDYNYPAKRHWRKTVWNRIEELLKVRLQKHPRDAVVLYLAGRGDFDAEEAMRRGFSPNNLIAVERDSDVATLLRSKKRLTIRGTMLDVLHDWNPNTHIDVLLIDGCSQLWLNNNTALLNACLQLSPSLNNTAVMINFLKGREKDDNARRAVRQFKQTEIGAHRGFMWWCYYKLCIFQTIGWGQHQPDCGAKLIQAWKTDCGLRLTYKSTNGQVFDSVVFLNQQVKNTPPLAKLGPSAMSQQIAAIKATRTRMIQS